jgi:ribonucleoside-diphosphate reductase alpha chain
MEQMRGKYLVQNRVTQQIYETPQVCYILIAATLFQNYPAETRLHWVKEYYEAISTHLISLPTPVMAGVRTNQRQFSSCVLVETGDSLDSINATTSAIVRYVSQKAGIGIGGGRIRALKSPIRNGDAYHTGVIPFYKLFQSAVKSCSQGGVRNGSATLYYPIWHLEVEDLLVLKNNKGTEDNRIRQMDYGVQFNKVMYERLLSGGNITLFSPSDVPGLYDAFFADTEEFRRLYTQAEANPAVRKKTVKASELFSQFAQERKDTGRIYLQNVDHANSHSPFDPAVAPIKQSNLCLTGDTLIDVQYPTGKQEQIDLQSFVERWELGGMNGVKVKSYDSNTGRIVWCDVSAAAQTGTATEMIEIQDEKGHVVVCTPEHQIYTRNRGYVMAKDLQETDELCVEM